MAVVWHSKLTAPVAAHTHLLACTQVYVSNEDFDILTESGKLADEDGNMTLEHFEISIRQELKSYVDRQIAKQIFLSIHHGPESTTALLQGMKALVSQRESNHSGDFARASSSRGESPSNFPGGTESVLQQMQKDQKSLLLRLHGVRASCLDVSPVL